VAGVYVGRPAVLGSRRGRPVRSAIIKRRVAAAELALSEVNLDGDQQADLSVHGGPDKAVYSYPTEHYPAWEHDSPEPFELDPGTLGENVSTAGGDESGVRIGDRWAWGSAVVEVSQPRSPCFKLAMHTGRREIIAAMLRSGRCGWYLRVIRPGTVPTSGTMTLLARDEAGPTVADVYRAANARAGELAAEEHRRLLYRAVRAPALSEGWRQNLAAKLTHLD
jgi:MOSC domain-containing protein YiiM